MAAFTMATSRCIWFSKSRGGDLVTVDGGVNGRKGLWLALAGFAIILAGAWLAMSIRTAGGIAVHDIHFSGKNGTRMSALLYIPKQATAARPVPGILAVHGYINSRETQDGFAIEFARRGYVVLAMDQTGHGYSRGAATSNGFGGPDGLQYLRSLPMVDKAQIGLEGHSMGGWTILAAASAFPDDYTSMVLEGSSTGAPFAADGTPDWPRNAAVVFSKYDEFADLMWGTPRAMDVAESTKLHAVFGTSRRIASGKLYGSVERGTARILYQPATTHPGDHFSAAAIGYATDWFARTLKGGTPKPASDQIWYWKEFGTGVGLIGVVMFLLGVFDLIIRLPAFAPIRSTAVGAYAGRDRTYWRAFAWAALAPALLFFPVFSGLYLLSLQAPVFPQVVTTQVAAWALLGAAIAAFQARKAITPNPVAQTPAAHWPLQLVIAVLTLAGVYGVLILIDAAFVTDLRFWIVALKVPAAHHWWIIAIYLLPITGAFLISMRSITGLTVSSDSAAANYGWAVLAMTGGFLLLLVPVYAIFFATGNLLTAFDPLSTVIALQFVPVLAALAIIQIFTWRRTGNHRAGALICGIFVTMYVVAGTATQLPI
jgi:pimeloyl-ACP methyl ester carboxylesterase